MEVQGSVKSDNREYFLLNELIDSVLSIAEEDQYIVYTNSDCYIDERFYDFISDSDYDYIEFFRQDVDNNQVVGSNKDGIDGFAGNVFAIKQDNTHILYLATENGVYNFDGYKFEKIKPKTPLKSNYIRNIGFNQDDNLIIINRREGIYEYNKKKNDVLDYSDVDEDSWRCPDCPGEAKLSDWFKHILTLHQLKEGGYPFDKNDLSIEEWMALAEIKTEFQKMMFETEKK
jgi:hypothetical protein